jgi:ATP-dependent Lhr-like helicase
MEMRGQVRRGYFVRGLPGVQFALPEAVEGLRAVADAAEGTDDRSASPPTVLNACDPANLYGPTSERVLPARRDSLPLAPDGRPLAFARVPSTWLVQQRGLPILLAEDTGSRLTAAAGAEDAQLQEALLALLGHLSHFAPRVTAVLWNGSPVLESPNRRLLESVGFYPDAPGMTWES